ncbi:MAG TPA: P22 phage major capsid protein family protein [Halothiobacillus sp.]|nr:MAG: hypothetical protein B7X10_00010 [Burkholderiales bacterium 21-58-4]HUN00410.1 P22 phage major capsid protein family protein [Halothiobacillus sp.]
MANTLLTPQMVTKEALPLFMNSNAFLGAINKEYSDQFARTGAKIGATLNIRRPSSFTVSDGPNLAVQNDTQIQTPLTVSKQKHVDIAFTSVEQALSLMEFRELVLRPAMNNLAAFVASDIMSLANTSPNLVGNGISIGGGGTLVSPTAATFNQARAQLAFNSAPMANLSAVMDFQTDARTANSMQGLFNPTGRISEQFDSGEVKGPAMGIAKYMSDQTTQVFTVGAYGTMPTVNGANQTGTTITVNAGTGSLNVGDIITFAGVYAVNPITFLSTGQLRQFVVTQPYSAGTTLSIYPALTPISLTNGVNTVQFATVTTSPANSAAITNALPAGTQYRKNIVFNKNAWTLATVDLPMYEAGVVSCHRESFGGISLRFLQTYVPGTDQLVSRMDILYGYAALIPEWSCVVPDVL